MDSHTEEVNYSLTGVINVAEGVGGLRCAAATRGIAGLAEPSPAEGDRNRDAALWDAALPTAVS